MEKLRSPFQGVWNILRFNWHFYAIAFITISGLFLFFPLLNENIQFIGKIIAFVVLVTIFISLLISWYVYDLSGFYKLNWLNGIKIKRGSKLININAGFDEISILLKEKYPSSDLEVFDFYNHKTHTEISIRRARKAYPPFPETKQIRSTHVELTDNSIDVIFLIFSAHEIRDFNERVMFFKELQRILKPSGRIIVTEHLRDIPNFIAYNIGFFHFFSLKNWMTIFKHSNFKMKKHIKFNLFVNTLILEKHGTSS